MKVLLLFRLTKDGAFLVNKRFATAIHILSALAYHDHQAPLNSDILARSINTNPVVVRRILKKLTVGGIVQTQRGKHGGVRLAKKPALIKLSDVYDCVESRQLISMNEKPPKKDCPVSCSMGKIMESLVSGVENSVKLYLSKQSLQELVRKI